MADELQNPVDSDQTATSTRDTQLEYPQLLIEASFESLLSHSHSSGTQSVGAMPRSELSLSESWSSLSEIDDDLQSDVTDTGSLIDVSTTRDVHTVDDHGQSSDAEEDDQDREHDEQDEDEMVSDETDSIGDVRVYNLHHSHPRPQECIRLDDSTVVVDKSGATSLQASRVYTDAELRNASGEGDAESAFTEAVGFIKMSMSSESMRLKQRPYHILYHGSAFSSPQIKSEVLGKVGAALITSEGHRKLDDDTECPCFHVVPAEFGPGSRPSTADLIPIPTQMHVSECTVLEPQIFDSLGCSIRLRLNTGRTIVSRQASIWDTGHKQQWVQPDLCVIVVSQHETQEGRMKAQRVAEFAQRHTIAVLCLRQEAGWSGDSLLADADPHMLHKSIQFPTRAENKMLLDVDTFLALDIEQLNHHLNYITTSAQSATEVQNFLANRLLLPFRNIYHRLTTFKAQKRATNITKGPQSWVVEILGPHATYSQLPSQEKENQTLRWSSKASALTLTAVFRTAMMVLFAVLTTSMLYAGRTWIAQVTTAMTSANRNLTVDPISTFETLYLPSSVSNLPAVSSSTAQSFALSAPLQAIEKQLQNWIPSTPNVKKGSKYQAQDTESRISNATISQACHSIVPAHISPNLKVDASFFRSGEPQFDVRVQRNGERLTAKVERQTDGTAAILIKRKECYGQLIVHLDQAETQVCASIDLENSVGEALALWLKSLRSKNHKYPTAKRFANEYTRILEVRTAKPGIVHNALELHYSATRGIGAAFEAVEKTAVKHMKHCHKNKKQCFGQDLIVPKELSVTVQHVKDMSEDLIQNTREQISRSTRHARHRANKAAGHAKEEMSRAVQAMQVSISELSVYKESFCGRMRSKLAKAQDHARELVNKS